MADNPTGLACPECGSCKTCVRDSRPDPAGLYVRRRRKCEACGSRFTTREEVVPDTSEEAGLRNATWRLVGPDGRVQRFTAGELHARMWKALTGEG